MILNGGGRSVFPIGMYEQPRTEGEWHEWSEAGINLLRCGNREDLDRAQEWGMMGWVPVGMILKDEDDGSSLVERIESLKDHPALVVWEAPDEAIWNACRLDTGIVTTRIWGEPPDVRNMLEGRLDLLVRGLGRGSAIVRKHDPGGKIWLNEACKSDQDTLARCLPFLDIVGYDYYPIPHGQKDGRAMHHIGGYTERFRRTAPHKDLWVVQQAFSWSNIKPESGRPEAYPNVDEYRFMAWEAIAHGATGLLWWGSHEEKHPAPFLHDLMKMVGELKELQPFLMSGDIRGVEIRADPRQNPAVLGLRGLVRRSGKRTMLVILNEDPHEHDAMVSGLDWVDQKDLAPVMRPSSGFSQVSEGWITTMEGHEVRIYLAE